MIKYYLIFISKIKYVSEHNNKIHADVGVGCTILFDPDNPAVLRLKMCFIDAQI